MGSRIPETPPPEARGRADPTAPPPLGDLDYRIQGLLQTDSKMSEILLATDRRGQPVIMKIACVQQRSRADANRRAIHNSVTWLQQLGGHRGIAQMQPIRRKGHSRWRTWSTPPTFVATLPDWPGNPDFLITEYLAGGTLSHFVGKRPLPVDLALSIAHNLAQTLADLHAQHCVHRDLKPENILFRVTPTRTAPPGQLQPVLIDFGVAARIGDAKLISGSRLWMAPELQVAYEKSLLPVDPSWDVYALGLICCYMLSGTYPSRRQHDYQDYLDYRNRVFALLYQEAANADPAWRQIVDTLQQLLIQTLALEPHKRPSAAEFATTLAALLTQMGIVLSPDGLRSKAWHQWRQPGLRLKPLYGRLLGLVLLVVASALWLAPRLRHVQGNDENALAPTFPTVASITMINTAQTPAPLPTGSVQAMHTAQATGQPPTLVRPTVGQPTLPPPTHTALPTRPPIATPTLVDISIVQQGAPPTLVQFTPTLAPTATPLPTQTPTPTATIPPPTPTPPPTVTSTRPVPTRSPTPLVLGTIRLLAPPADSRAAQERVEFAWTMRGATLTPAQCYELVFWDPAKVHDKRSPIGAGRTEHGVVNFSKLRDSTDPLLRTLAHSQQGFNWGVRLVACSSPQTVLQDVNETRHYTYQP